MKFEILTWIKFAFATLAGWGLSFFLPISNFIVLAITLIVADFATGVWAAKKRGDKITSSGFRRTINKVTLYCLAVILAHAVEEIFFSNYNVIPITYVIACFLCLTEFKSALENIGDITGTNAWIALRSYLDKFLKLNQ